MADFVELAFDLAFKYKTPAMILSDGLIGQMMEKVELKDYTPRWTNEYISENIPWATTGKQPGKRRSTTTSLNLKPEEQEAHNIKLQAKYQEIKDNEVRVEFTDCEDADYIFIAFGSVARICQKAKDMAREKGYKIGVVRPITVWPYPEKEIRELASKVKGFMCVEMNSGQMLQDVKLAVEGTCPVEFHGRMGGMVPSPEEIIEKFEEKFIK
jgi:2-oxoglutarate ferredoxin oxidoreductase subunit alpha